MRFVAIIIYVDLCTWHLLSEIDLPSVGICVTHEGVESNTVPVPCNRFYQDLFSYHSQRICTEVHRERGFGALRESAEWTDLSSFSRTCLREREVLHMEMNGGDRGDESYNSGGYVTGQLHLCMRSLLCRAITRTAISWLW